MAQRILVIDDVADMRTLIRRALGASGYEVDVAATATEALAMNPGGYDAIVVDVNLGAERGTDLIEMLRSQDEAIADRCLVITGGAVDELPERVAGLAKPFGPGELLDAVRALGHPPTAAKPGEPATGPATGPATDPDPAVGPQLGQLLRIFRRLRARERCDLADYLHAGPIQELAAASLELQLMRPSAPCAPQVDFLQQRVDGASAALRRLVDGAWSLRSAQTRLTETVSARTAWLLPAPATVDADLPAQESGATQAPLIADVVELVLQATEAAGSAARAHIAVRMDESRIEIDLTLRPGGDDEALGDPAVAQSELDLLAAALGADLHAEFTGSQWRVGLVTRNCTA